MTLNFDAAILSGPFALKRRKYRKSSQNVATSELLDSAERILGVNRLTRTFKRVKMGGLARSRRQNRRGALLFFLSVARKAQKLGK